MLPVDNFSKEIVVYVQEWHGKYYILFESFGDDYIGTQIFLSNHDVKFYDSFISQVFFFFWKRKNCFFW